MFVFAPMLMPALIQEGQYMPFKATKEQLARRDVLAAGLRTRAHALSAAIAAFNEQVEPLSRAVAEAQVNYNETLEQARTLASQVCDTAQEDAKS
jgi:hypothetical protein